MADIVKPIAEVAAVMVAGFDLDRGPTILERYPPQWATPTTTSSPAGATAAASSRRAPTVSGLPLPTFQLPTNPEGNNLEGNSHSDLEEIFSDFEHVFVPRQELQETTSIFTQARSRYVFLYLPCSISHISYDRYRATFTVIFVFERQDRLHPGNEMVASSDSRPPQGSPSHSADGSFRIPLSELERSLRRYETALRTVVTQLLEAERHHYFLSTSHPCLVRERSSTALPSVVESDNSGGSGVFSRSSYRLDHSAQRSPPPPTSGAPQLDLYDGTSISAFDCRDYVRRRGGDGCAGPMQASTARCVGLPQVTLGTVLAAVYQALKDAETSPNGSVRYHDFGLGRMLSIGLSQWPSGREVDCRDADSVIPPQVSVEHSPLCLKTLSDNDASRDAPCEMKHCCESSASAEFGESAHSDLAATKGTTERHPLWMLLEPAHHMVPVTIRPIPGPDLMKQDLVVEDVWEAMNGYRSIRDIALLLRLPLPMVADATRLLMAMGCVAEVPRFFTAEAEHGMRFDVTEAFFDLLADADDDGTGGWEAASETVDRPVDDADDDTTWKGTFETAIQDTQTFIREVLIPMARDARDHRVQSAHAHGQVYDGFDPWYPYVIKGAPAAVDFVERVCDFILYRVILRFADTRAQLDTLPGIAQVIANGVNADFYDAAVGTFCVERLNQILQFACAQDWLVPR